MDAEHFVSHWSAAPISERAQYQSFIRQLCDLLGVPAPDDEKVGDLAYTFERSVRFKHDDGTSTAGYIDCYKKDCFVLEAKQSKKRQPGGELAPQLALNLGGDVAVAGRCPKGGWVVGIATDCATPVDAVDEAVTLFHGGLATSGTTGRTWVRNGRTIHHIVDPWTGDAAPVVWSLVSTMAPSCVEANAWSTAAIVWGHDAVGNLSSAGVPARLVTVAGEVVRVRDWPTDLTDLAHHAHDLNHPHARGSVGR